MGMGWWGGRGGWGGVWGELSGFAGFSVAVGLKEFKPQPVESSQVTALLFYFFLSLIRLEAGTLVNSDEFILT